VLSIAVVDHYSSWRLYRWTVNIKPSTSC